MSVTDAPSVYDRLRQQLDAEDLLRRLGVAVVRKLGSEAYCNPLCHESTSGESLQVNLHTGRWNCKACQHAGVSGDLIQLAEYVLSGGRPPSHGSAQGASESHREAVRWLCQQYAIPFNERGKTDQSLDVVHLFAMAAHEHLLGNDLVLDWILQKWGFDRSVVESYGIGYMPDPILPELANEANRAEAKKAFRSSGLGFYPPDGRFTTRFAGRVTFPYLEHGRAVYLIGRATPWTPPLEGGVPAPKYHKLSVHSETRPYVSERITNDHLYNEPVMSGADEIGVLEGVTDGVAISSLGVACVSPVTISFNAVDIERFVRKCKENKIRRVWILFDNELSGSGNYAAQRAGEQLVDRGLCASVLTLPLGPEQSAARDEVLKVLGADLFEELERAEPHKRKAIIADHVKDDLRGWVVAQINASKIDAAEWCAAEGAAAPGKFDAIRKAGTDVVDAAIAAAADGVDADDDAHQRIAVFAAVITLAAHVDDALMRESYAGKIAKVSGKGVTKAHVLKEIRSTRKSVVEPKRKKAAVDAVAAGEGVPNLILLPPSPAHSQPAAPPPPVTDPTAPPAPPPPGAKEESEHERFREVRDSVSRSVDAKVPDEIVGEHVAQTITVSMGYTAFRTPDELYLVRGNERVPVGLDRPTPRFAGLLYMASGLSNRKNSHRPYIGATCYFLDRDARKAQDVSWSHVGKDGSVYFPTGDLDGRILRIGVGTVERTRMAEVKVPAVSGSDFQPFKYTDEEGGIADAIRAFRWTSISPSDRMILVHWIACLPILRRIGTVPIVRIEGGSSSGKTRAVDAVSFLVNGGKSSSVPTAAALISRLSVEMLTIDDNREAGDVTPQFLGTLLQATHLGAREKRQKHSDTGTVIERVCGGLLMNGIEPIHDGRSEVASRMLTLRCATTHREPDSPVANERIAEAVLACRDRFWSDAVRRCARALELDLVHGEEVGAQIEDVFGSTRIGRLSSYVRLMYLTWVAGLPAERQEEFAGALSEEWREALTHLGDYALESLIRDELAVAAIRYAFAWAMKISEPKHTGSEERVAFDGKFKVDTSNGDAVLGVMRIAQLTRIVRTAARELNGPRSITHDLKAGQLEARVLDGLEFLRGAGFEVTIDPTRGGRMRFSFYRRGDGEPVTEEAAREAGFWNADSAGLPPPEG